MITHANSKKPAPGPKPGEIHAARVRILGPCKAEVIIEGGKHEMKELAIGDVVICPIWSAKDLVMRKMAIFI